MKLFKSRRQQRNTLMGLFFASPWIIGFCVLFVYPILISIYYSFTKFNIIQTPAWVGVKNYTRLFGNELFYKSLWNTCYMVALATPVNIAFGLVTALLLNLKVKGQAVYRTVYYLPSIIPVVATSLLWLWVLNAQYGLVNSFLKGMGLYQPNWFADPFWAKPSMIIMGLSRTGGIMIIFLAALQDVPRSLYESAEIDGANNWHKFWSITIPGISPVILFQVIMGIIYHFQYFTEAYIIIGGLTNLNTAGGGPENSLLFYGLSIYQNAFQMLKMGRASAMAWILFVLVVGVTAITYTILKRRVTYGYE